MKRREMREYRIWLAMKARCYAPSATKGNYKKYGIKVCDRWRNSFENFLADMGECPFEDASIERIDNHGNYCPENCKWIRMREQPKNRSNVPMYEYNGEKHGLKEWSRILLFDYERVRGRIRRGLTFEEALDDTRFDKRVTIEGITMTVKAWCDKYRLNPGNVYSRIHRGWSAYDAIMKDQDKIQLK